MKKASFLTVIFLITICVFANQKSQIMHSNKINIKLLIGEGKNDWRITPELKPDYLNLYSETEKIKKIKFISDVDSLEFKVKINKPVSFTIILKNKDTAQVVINFSNKVPHTLTDKDKIYALSLFWSEVKYNFAFVDKIKFDIDSLYKAYILKVSATSTDYDFYDQMELFACRFKDLHTDIFYRKRNVYTDYIPLLAHYFGDSLFIINANESIVEKFPIGSKILKINNLSTEEYMRKYIEPYIPSNFEPTKRVLSANKLFASDLSSKKITITYQTLDGRTLTNTLTRNGRTVSGKTVGYQYQYWDKPIELKWLRNNIAQIVVNTFQSKNELISIFESIKDTLYNASGIIIDLRSNRGGSTSSGLYLLQYIIKDPYFLTFAWQTRINDGVKKATGNFKIENNAFFKNNAFQLYSPDSIMIPDSIKRFNVPIAVLISENTCSAAEDFLIILKERKDRPIFIGRPTMGSTGSPLVLDKFPEDGLARVCTRRVLYPYSLKPFNEGIEPDIMVNYSFNEYLNQKIDKDIDVAIDYLTNQINNSNK